VFCAPPWCEVGTMADATKKIAPELARIVAPRSISVNSVFRSALCVVAENGGCVVLIDYLPPQFPV
jgi:hypothetical protein